MTGTSPPGRVRLLAHRGASALEPEHSRSAYVRAIADGADGLECDVRLTRDGVAVCWHDATLDRTSDACGPVHEATLEQLRSVRLRRPREAGGAWSTVGEVLTLRELLELALAAGRALTVAVELKHPAPYDLAAEEAVLADLAELGWDASTGTLGALRISLMSFHPDSLAHLALRVPAQHLMVLLDVPDDGVPDEHGLDDVLDGVLMRTTDDDPGAAGRAAAWRLAGGDPGGASAAGTGVGVGPGLDVVRRYPERVRAWVRSGRAVRVWTVNTREDAAACVALGVVELTTDDPGALRSGV